MEYRILKYFLTVAREENITRAADILHISQPALSRQMMQLEEELGAQLFVRGRHSTKLTEDGMFLRRRAQEIIDLTEKTEREFLAGKEEIGGIISIGSGEGAVMRFLAKIMREFSERYPDVRFDLYSNDADHVKERLERGTLDIGVIIGSSDLSKYESIPLPVTERWGAIVPAKCPLSQKEHITREDLVGHKVFVSRRGVTQGVADWFGEYYEKMEIYATYNLLYNAAVLVDSEIGAALCIEGAVSLYNSPSVIFKPFYPELTAGGTLIYKGQPMTRTVSKFIDFIKEHCKEM